MVEKLQRVCAVRDHQSLGMWPGTDTSSLSPLTSTGSTTDRKTLTGSPADRKTKPTTKKVMVNLLKEKNSNLSILGQGTWLEAPGMGSGSSPSSWTTDCDSSPSLGREEGGRSYQGAPVIVPDIDTLCATVSQACCTQHFTGKISKTTNVTTPETTVQWERAGDNEMQN